MSKYRCKILDNDFDVLAERIFEADSEDEALDLAEIYANQNYYDEWNDIESEEI